MNNNINSKLLQCLSLVFLLCGLTVTMNAQKTGKQAISKNTNTSSQSTELQIPNNLVVIDFVIEDDIMQSTGGSDESDDTKDGGKNNINKSFNPIGSDVVDEGLATSTLQRLASQIKVYPIPAISFTNVDLGTLQANQINIINGLGQVVNTVQINQQLLRLDISNLNSGIYYIKINTIDEQVVTKTILVQ